MKEKPVSEVRRSKSAPSGCITLDCFSPVGLGSLFQVLRDLLVSEARYQCSLTQLSYPETVVHSKPWVVFLHNEGVAVKYFPSLTVQTKWVMSQGY